MYTIFVSSVFFSFHFLVIGLYLFWGKMKKNPIKWEASDFGATLWKTDRSKSVLPQFPPKIKTIHHSFHFPNFKLPFSVSSSLISLSSLISFTPKLYFFFLCNSYHHNSQSFRFFLFFWFHICLWISPTMSTEKERETQVYLAKLAEQAERYEGYLILFYFLILKFSFLWNRCF